MRRGGFQRGSALLIVLGMMMVIVVSAVAFSAYMRYSRVPSSFLRQTSSSRLLAKAALAEAIERIDCAIGNNIYPGIMQNHYVYPRTGGTKIGNHWEDRVFIGGTNSSQTASIEDTVSVLNVEALAYLPPPLINDVRFWSRRSLAAVWEPMGFDAGRYAFCAVDVSDYIDINRIWCAQTDSTGNKIYGRTSTPDGRISLSYAFEKADHTDYQTITPEAWDQFMDTILGSGNVPLVSLADYNLAINSHGWTEFMSPFCNFFLNNQPFVSSRSFSPSADEAEFLRHQVFVTDSLVGERTPLSGDDGIDLADEKNQPFDGYSGIQNDDDTKNDVDLSTLVTGTMNDFYNEIELYNKRNGGNKIFADPGEYIMLYDYLDRDSVPSSLAMPTMERTPMICGVSLEGCELSVEVEKSGRKDKPAADGYWVSYDYTLKVKGQFDDVNVGTVFPFKYNRGKPLSDLQQRYKVQAAATIVFVPSDWDRVRRKSALAALAITKNDWKTSKQNPTVKTFGRDDLGKVIVMQSDLQSVKLPSQSLYTKDAIPDDAVSESDVQLGFGKVDLKLTTKLPADVHFDESTCSYRVAKKYVLDVNGTGGGTGDTGGVGGLTLGGKSYVPDSSAPFVQYGWLPATAALDGTENLQDGTTPGSGSYVPVIQLWVRIIDTDSNNEVVDLVPAFIDDDKNPLTDPLFARDAKLSVERPFLRFFDKTQPNGNGTVKLSGTSFDDIKMDATTDKLVIYPQAYIADDPRFNYAPENLVAMASYSESSLGKEWLVNQRSGANDKDGDIFMMTSDAGYLQSKYELANILRISDLRSPCDDGTMRTSFGQSPAENVMWRSYSLGWNGTDDLSDLQIFSGDGGFRINPYTPSTEVMMFALANTPFDWWAASTNYVDTTTSAKSSLLGNLNEAYKYSFSEMPGATVDMMHGVYREDEKGSGKAQDGLLLLAETMKDAFRSSPDWEAAYKNLGWGTANAIAGIDLGVNLHSVDRKYLYGYWKECFAARQQLFLVFIRAEPMMMGGGTRVQSPPQLGARAVALVWRDPTPTAEDVQKTKRNLNGNYVDDQGGSQPQPHRSRILFYRQFD